MTYLFSNSQLMAYWKSASLSACLITAYLLDSLGMLGRSSRKCSIKYSLKL
jgi:hypothetical protein